MPRTKLTPQVIVRTGLTPSFSAADGTNHHSFDNSGKNLFIECKNAAGAPINLTVDMPVNVDGLAVPDLVVAVPATTGDKMIGPFPGYYEQADSGNSLTNAILFQVSSATSVTVGVFQLPKVT